MKTIRNFMKTILKFFTTILLFSITKIAVSQSITFERYYDLGVGDVEQAYCVQQTFDGGYIMAGRKGQGGSTKFLIAKVDSMGIYQWHKTYGYDGTFNLAQSIFQTSDSGFIVTGGLMETNGLNYVGLLKLNNFGDSLWLKKFIYTNQNAVWGVKVIQNADEGYTLLSDVVDSADYKWTAFLTRTDTNGNELWTKQYKKEQGSSPGSFLATQDSGYIIATYTNPSINDNDIYLIKTNSIGDTLWTKTIAHPLGFTYNLTRSNCINPTTDGGYIIAGTIINNSNIQDSKALIIKLNNLGDTIWTRILEPFLETPIGASNGFEATDGNYYFVGGFISDSTENDIILIKTDTNGNILWVKVFGGVNLDVANYARLIIDGGVIICGMETSWGDGGGIYLIKTDSLGNAQSYINGVKSNIVGSNSLIEIYPNPFTEYAKVIIKSGEARQGTFSIINSIGSVVKVYEVSEALFYINKEKLAPGIYYGVFQSKHFSNPLSIKFIIQ